MFLSTATPRAFASPPELGLGEICLRLLCAMIVGMVIGTEREYTHRPAGMRTHILVALGACAVMITGQMIFLQYHSFGATPDPSRLGAQVITGVGFLGAGTILRQGANVKGLTTAASLWTVACLGLAAGGGYYAVAVIGMGFIFVTLTIFEILQRKIVGPQAAMHTYRLETKDIALGLLAVNTAARKNQVGIRDLEVRHQEDGNYRICFRSEIGGFRGKKRRQAFFETLVSDPAIAAVHNSDAAEGSAIL